MNELSPSPGINLYPQPAKQPRRDFLTAQRVEVGITIQMLEGTQAAAEYLNACEIDLSVAARTLTQPLNRRSWRDWNYRFQPDDHF